MRMSPSGRLRAAVPPSTTHLSRPAVAAAVPAVAVVVLAGVWVAGGLLTDDEAVARRLVGAWFALAGVVAVVVALRWRQLAPPVLAAWFLTSGAAGGFLLLTSSVDRVVDERVTVAGPPATEPSGPARSVARGGRQPSRPVRTPPWAPPRSWNGPTDPGFSR